MPTGRTRALLRLALLPALIGIAAIVAWRLGYFALDQRQLLLERVQRLRLTPGVELGFTAGFALVVVLCLPATIVTVLAGAVFGGRVGALVALGGQLLGTLAAYLVARRVARRPIEAVFGDHRLLRLLRDHDDIASLFRVRVLPLAPFGVLPYVAGIAGISLNRLLVATLLGALPGAIAYSYVGSELLLAAVMGGDASKRSLWIAAAVTLAMVGLSTLPRLLRRSRR